MRFWFSLLSNARFSSRRAHAAALVLSACFAFACGSTPASEAPSTLARFPEMPLVSLENRPFSLAALRRGRPALVSLWATWCEGCEREMGALNRLHEELGERALVVGIAVGEPSSNVRSYLSRRGARYPELVDERFALADALHTTRVPSTFVVDADGVIRYRGGTLGRAALGALESELRRTRSAK